MLSCKGLEVRYGTAAKIAPFFYYQFFTFEEKFSRTGAGPNPTFQDTEAYTMRFDDGTMKYLEEQYLEIMFIDDNAPAPGIEAGA